MSAGLWFSACCRQCGAELEAINDGGSDGVRSTWVGKCGGCRREYAVVAEMVALHSPSFRRNPQG